MKDSRYNYRVKTELTVIFLFSTVLFVAPSAVEAQSVLPLPPQTQSSSNTRSGLSGPLLRSQQRVQTEMGETKLARVPLGYKPLYLSSITVYPTPSFREGRKVAFNDFVYLINHADGERWVQICDKDFVLHWIYVKDIRLSDFYHTVNTDENDYSNSYVNAQRLEQNLIRSQNVWKRYGPYLVDTRNEGMVFADRFGIKGPWYSLNRLDGDSFAVIHVQHYEGDSYVLVDMATGTTSRPLYSQPHFSPSYRHFISYGAVYDEPCRLLFFDRVEGRYRLAASREIGGRYPDRPELKSIRWISDGSAVVKLAFPSGSTTEYAIVRRPNGEWGISRE